MDEALAALHESLLAADTTDQMANLIQEEYPAYRKLAESEKVEWRRFLREVVELFVRLDLEKRGLAPAEIAAIERIGEMRADQGVSLGAIEGSLRCGMHVALSATRRAAEGLDSDGKPGEAVEALSLRVAQFLNAVSRALTTGHTRRQAVLAKSVGGPLASLAVEVLTGARPDAAIVQRAASLGVDLTGPIGIVLVPGNESSEPVANARVAVQSSLVAPGATDAASHCAVVVPNAVAAKWHQLRRPLERLARDLDVTLVVCGPCGDVREIAQCYEEGAAAFALAHTLADGRPVVEVRELIPALMAATASSAAVSAIEREVLIPLRTNKRASKLLPSLDALMQANGSAKGAARRRGLTERTLTRHKLEIEAITSLRFDRPDDALRLAIARFLARGVRTPVVGRQFHPWSVV